MLEKPAAVSGRDAEWAGLVDFVTAPGQGASLGLVYGRRRQGKTFLLEHLVRACGGFMFAASQQSGAQQLRDLGEAYARFTGAAAPVAFPDWRTAIDALLRLGEAEHPVPVVIDEFPYLLDIEPALPSIIQATLDPGSRAMRQSRTRLILCGSALTTMRRLLAGSAPLRGRAVLELMLQPFRFREAAHFWGLDDPDLAFRVHALVGGTPAYLGMSGGRPPRSARDFDRWVVGGPLSPLSALHREGNVLLYEEPEVAEPAVYFSVLSAIARGAARRGEIATALARPDSALSHPLAVLEHLCLVERVEDAFRRRRPIYRITEPIIRFHQLVIQPWAAPLAALGGEQVWFDVADTVGAKINGPHLEELARMWCLMHAATETLGGRANKVRSATLACPLHRQGHELDVVAIQDLPQQSSRVVAIGEVKATRGVLAQEQLTRIEHLRTLLPAERTPEPPRLLLFSRSGFTAGLRRTAQSRRDVELVDLPRLYHGG